MASEQLWLESAVADALRDGHLRDPFSILGPHVCGNGTVVRSYLPGARSVEVIAADGDELLAVLKDVQMPGLFVGLIPDRVPYRLRIAWPDSVQETEDPYSFGLLLGDMDIYLLAEGRHFELPFCLGASAMAIGGVAGVRFAVWAPNARRVSVVGHFNSWDGRRHPMRLRVEAGIWELFVPRLQPGELYQFEILGANGLLPLKTDPVARQFEAPPRTAAVVTSSDPLTWNDAAWLQIRGERQALHAPLSIYELHAGSWRRVEHDQYRSPNWDELAEQLIPYVKQLGFTHIELLPIMAHPFGGSWGYQPLGLFAPQASYGDPAAFARFIDRCHAEEIGVILDWVPAHFPTDAHGLARFDGTALYEHEDPREGFHQDWNTLIYNLGRREVRGFLLASAVHWLEHFHIDGLRVDAVASMLYRDYSRRAGEWVPNRLGGRENLEAIEFLRELNAVVQERCPGTMVIAEESTAWPGVTKPIDQDGLGFTHKWNMGWMHDTLSYLQLDPLYRQYHNQKISFGLLYAFSEHFVLPLSHDEVVHGKGSLINKMVGDRWQRFANLRAYYGLMWTYPGKKLMFMGGEFAQEREWDHDGQLQWYLLDNDRSEHRGVQSLVRDLNHFYRNQPALYTSDVDSRGFQWIVCDDDAQSVFAFYRYAIDRDAAPILVVSNFTPIPRSGYRIGVPRAGFWQERINSDAALYGGSNMGNGGGVEAEAIPSHGHDYSVVLTLPPLATVMFST
jgi:1,4-alpha-glucan branching enzyme